MKKIFLFTLSLTGLLGLIECNLNFTDGNEYSINKKLETKKNESKLLNNDCLANNFENIFLRIDDSLPDWDYQGIEFSTEITVLDNNQDKAYYFDFTGNNGFIILSESKIYKLDLDSDLKELKTLDNLFYSSVDGFLTYNEEQNFFNKVYNNEVIDVLCGDDYINSPAIAYDGQLENPGGDGEIYNLGEYVEDRYGTYKLEEIYYLKNYKNTSQSETSVYMNRKFDLDGDQLEGGFSEGNCVINSCYSLLLNLPTCKNYYGYQRRYNENFKKGNTTIDYWDSVTLDPLYYDFGRKNYDSTVFDESLNKDVKYCWVLNTEERLRNLPKIYMELRSLAITHGYLPNKGMNFGYSEDMIEKVGTLYDYNIDLQLTNSSENVINNIKNGVPSLISTNGSETYNNHAMAVFGYAKYSYEVQVLRRKETRYTYFWAVDSGHTYRGDELFYDENENFLKWFDPNQSSSSFGVLDRNNLTWPKC